MDELEKALGEYLAKNFESESVVAVKRLRDEVAAKFITTDLPLSEALSAVARFVRAMVEQRFLLRVGPGLYRYWPERRAQGTPPSPLARAPARRALDDASDNPSQRDNFALAFESIGALARSDRFLVQRDLSEVDLVILQGLSF